MSIRVVSAVITDQACTTSAACVGVYVGPYTYMHCPTSSPLASMQALCSYWLERHEESMYASQPAKADKAPAAIYM